MPRTPSLSRELLNAALEGLESQRQLLDEQIAQVRRLLGTAGRATATAGRTPQKRTMSAAGRKRIAEAQRKRWEAFHRQSAQATPPKKRRLSPAGRRAIGEAARRRWAAVRAAKRG